MPPSNTCRVGLVVLALAWPLACGPEPAGETASTGPSTTTSATNHGTTDAGQSVTSDTPLIITTTTTSTSTSTTTGVAPTTGPGTTGASDSSGGDSFIVPPDYGDGSGCPAGVLTKSCDPWSQDCWEGEKCAPYSGGCGILSETHCTAVVRDPVALGGACLIKESLLSGRDDCDIGLMCFYADPDSLIGTCVSLCVGSPDIPDCAHSPGTSCKIFEDTNSIAGLCLPTCDPQAPACPAGQVCQPNPSQPADFVCVQDD